MNTIKNWALALLKPIPLLGLIYLPRYVKHWVGYSRLNRDQPLRLDDSYPCLTDWVAHTPFDPHYFFQGAWLARRIQEVRPGRHVDVGSSVMTVGVLSANVDTLFVDYRPLMAKLPRLTSVAANITSLPFGTGAVESLSCLHVLEHIGLGRYGDPIDPSGSEKGAHELERILKPGGTLYLSLPVGRHRTCFNAHRVFAPEHIPAMFPALRLAEFSYVDDSGAFWEKRPLQSANGLDYGCGMFVLVKPQRSGAAPERADLVR